MSPVTKQLSTEPAEFSLKGFAVRLVYMNRERSMMRVCCVRCLDSITLQPDEPREYIVERMNTHRLLCRETGVFKFKGVL